jgi:hypothetical protein
MCQKGHEFSEQIIRDIRDGALSNEFEIDPRIRRELAPRLRADPTRAKELASFRERRSGKLLPADYWPRLAMIGCWKGGTVGHYLDQFDDWFNPDGKSPVPVRDLGYLSSEFRGSVPLSEEGSQGVLTVATNFYEFVAPDELEATPDDPSAWHFSTCD